MIRALLGVLGAAVLAVALAATAGADPGNGPPNCGLLAPLCAAIPMVPDIEGDIDLTKDQPKSTADENMPPVSPCTMGCI